MSKLPAEESFDITLKKTERVFAVIQELDSSAQITGERLHNRDTLT